jgi:hemoglobin-like flavoprotein
MGCSSSSLLPEYAARDAAAAYVGPPLCTIDQITLLKSHVRAFTPKLGDEGMADLFYGTLFELYPATEGLFPKTFARRRGKVLKMLATVISAQPDIPPHMRTNLRNLGHAHRDNFNVTADMFGPLRVALFTTLERALEDKWSKEEGEDAWNAVLELCEFYMNPGEESGSSAAAQSPAGTPRSSAKRDSITLAQRTWMLIMKNDYADNEERFGKVFYDTLFEADPELRGKLGVGESPSADQNKDAVKLIGGVAMLLSRPPESGKVLSAVAAKHEELGVALADNAAVEKALLATVETALGQDATTDAVREAWLAAYAEASQIMMA